MTIELTDELYKHILENLHDGVYFVDTERRITFWNHGSERITGYPSDRIVGSYCFQNILNHITENGTQLCMTGCPLLWTMRDGKPRYADVYLRHADGYRVPVSVRTAPLYDRDGKIVGAVESFNEITSRIAAQQRIIELERETLRDPLTEIGNRRFLEIKLSSALHEFHQHKLDCGVLFIDADRFKPINDNYGHKIGDVALRIISSTMKFNLRETDAFGRWGGDEFLAILFGVEEAGLAATAHKLRVLVENAQLPFGEEQVKLTVSIGATQLRLEDTPEAIIERADRLMYRSKLAGGNCVTMV